MTQKTSAILPLNAVNTYNVHLEALRGVAALLVVLTHLANTFSTSRGNYFFALFSAWGTEAVILFFILSGVVIHASFEQKKQSSINFICNRCLRLYPILLLSMIFTLWIDVHIFGHKVNVWNFVGNIIPVSSFNAALAPLYFQSNPVIWSLSFEVFFYFVFAIGCIRHGSISRPAIKIWFFLSLLDIIAYYFYPSSNFLYYLITMTAFSCIWLVGFTVWDLKNHFNIGLKTAVLSVNCLPLISRLHLTANFYDPIKYLMFALTSIPFFIYLCQLKRSSKAEKPPKSGKRFLILIVCSFFLSACLLLTDHSYKNVIKATYILLPFLAGLFYFTGIRNGFKMIYTAYLMPVFSKIGKLSYSIYLIHFPIIVVVSLLPLSIYLKALLVFVIVFALSWILEIYYQPFVKLLFTKTLKKSG